MKKIKRDIQNSAFSGFLIEILKLYAQAMENVPKEERNALLDANFSTLALLSAELTEAGIASATVPSVACMRSLTETLLCPTALKSRWRPQSCCFRFLSRTERKCSTSNTRHKRA